MASATLGDIQTLIRNLTNCVSPNQLTDTAINFAVNTFIAYDFPYRFHIRNLKTNISWYTDAYRDTYYVDTNVPTTDPLYDFENRYSLVNTPIYISGIPAWFTQTREEFYNRFQRNEYIENFAVGDGVTTNFTGNFQNKPVQQNTVIFTCQVNAAMPPLLPTIDTVTAVDMPLRLTDPLQLSSNVTYGNLINQSTQVNYGTINYITGAYDITWPYPPLTGTNIIRQSCAYTPGKPTSLLYAYLSYIDSTTGLLVNNKAFQVRPIPDSAYVVNMEVYRNPTELINVGDNPELNQWWQYIAYGAARKIMQRRSDEDGLKRIETEWREQELLVNRKTILQQTQQRSATIYGDNNGLSYGWPGWGWPQNW